MRAVLCFIVIAMVSSFASAQEEIKSIHVIVALCDNDSQGIVPVPKTLGNGDDPKNNLYWGALYGTKSYLKRSKDWTLLETRKKVDKVILERVIFKHHKKPVYLVADAYRGVHIKKAVEDFFHSVAENQSQTVQYKETKIGIKGKADLTVYVGHNGLMDFQLAPIAAKEDNPVHGAIVLACKSKAYFKPVLSKVGSRSVLLTTGFMAPEAYTLEAALAGWIAGESPTQIKERSAQAYHKYQKCGLKGARRLFYSE